MGQAHCRHQNQPTTWVWTSSHQSHSQLPARAGEHRDPFPLLLESASTAARTSRERSFWKTLPAPESRALCILPGTSGHPAQPRGRRPHFHSRPPTSQKMPVRWPHGRPPQHRVPRPRAPPPLQVAPVKACSQTTTGSWQSGEAERQVRRDPQFLLIKNPPTVLTWKICSVICDVIVQSGLCLEIT